MTKKANEDANFPEGFLEKELSAIEETQAKLLHPIITRLVKVMEDAYKTKVADLLVRVRELEWAHDFKEQSPLCTDPVNVTMEAERHAHGYLTRATDALCEDMTKCYDRIAKLEGYMEMEDRITVADVLLRLTKLEDLFAGRTFKPIHDAMETHIEKFNERISQLESQVSAINKQKFSEFHNLKPDLEKMKTKVNDIVDFDNSIKESLSQLMRRIDAIVEWNDQKLSARVAHEMHLQTKINELEEFVKKLNDSHVEFRMGFPKTVDVLVEENIKNVHYRIDQLADKWQALSDAHIELKMKVRCADKFPILTERISKEEFNKLYPDIRNISEDYVVDGINLKKGDKVCLKNQPKRHCCPSCKGTGKNMYFVETAPDNSLYLDCLLCVGEGVVWG